MTLCKELHEWVEQEVEKPIDEWVEKEVKKCKERKCKWWCGCCNKWFCWIEIAFVLVVRWVIVTVLKWVVRVVCEVVNVALNALAGIISILFFIPVLGRLLRQIWNFVVEIVWRAVGLIGLIPDLLGLDWEKKLRVCIIVLRDEKGVETAAAASLQPTIADAKTVWKNAANVKLIVDDIHTLAKGDSRTRNLDVECDTGAWTDDLLATGSNFELYANTYCFDGVFRRFIGLGAPVTVFVVRSIKNKDGCSLGLFGDYVTIEGASPHCLAHELAHACQIFPPFHDSDPNNLLHGQCGGTTLKKWQRLSLRNSRHITYF